MNVTELREFSDALSMIASERVYREKGKPVKTFSCLELYPIDRQIPFSKRYVYYVSLYTAMHNAGGFVTVDTLNDMSAHDLLFILFQNRVMEGWCSTHDVECPYDRRKSDKRECNSK